MSGNFQYKNKSNLAQRSRDAPQGKALTDDDLKTPASMMAFLKQRVSATTLELVNLREALSTMSKVAGYEDTLLEASRQAMPKSGNNDALKESAAWKTYFSTDAEDRVNFVLEWAYKLPLKGDDLAASFIETWAGGDGKKKEWLTNKRTEIVSCGATRWGFAAEHMEGLEIKAKSAMFTLYSEQTDSTSRLLMRALPKDRAANFVAIYLVHLVRVKNTLDVTADRRYDPANDRGLVQAIRFFEATLDFDTIIGQLPILYLKAFTDVHGIATPEAKKASLVVMAELKKGVVNLFGSSSNDAEQDAKKVQAWFRAVKTKTQGTEKASVISKAAYKGI